MGWWPSFTRKAKNTRTNQERANYQAEFQARTNFGRGRHSKVANVMSLAKGNMVYHDPFEARKQEYSQIFLKEAKNKADSITQEEKQGVIDWANELKYKASQSGGGYSNISDNITMTVPRRIVKVLLFLIGLSILAMGIGAVFVEIAAALAGAQGSLGLSNMFFTNAFVFMNLTTPRVVNTRNRRNNRRN